MITVVRSYTFAPEKAAEAIKARAELAKYVSELTGIPNTVLHNETGQLNQVHIVVSFESMAAHEEQSKKVWDDVGFQELRKASLSLYTGNNITIYRQVE